MKKRETKDIMVFARVTPSVFKELKRVAAKRGLYVSEILRLKINEVIKEGEAKPC